jgi:hypothetical protein
MIDVHRHPAANMRLNTILDLVRQHDLPLPAGNAKGLPRGNVDASR